MDIPGKNIKTQNKKLMQDPKYKPLQSHKSKTQIQMVVYGFNRCPFQQRQTGKIRRQQHLPKHLKGKKDGSQIFKINLYIYF